MELNQNNRVSICIPSKNNLRYLKACIPSIRKNEIQEFVDILVFVDKDEDGTVNWLEQNKDTYKLKYFVNPKLGIELYGIGLAYDYLIDKSETDIVMIFHADMMLGKNAIQEALKHLSEKTIVCSTRIEPPLHPEGLEKIVKDFGMWPEQDIEDGFKESNFNSFVEECKLTYSNKLTDGCFAPWMCFKKDIQSIGGHDPIMKSAREDSDLFNRFKLAGYAFIQSWTSYVYHLTCRGGQFEHGILTTDHSKKSRDWQELMNNSTKEFIRKWGTFVRTTNTLHPIVPHKYNITYVINGECNMQLLEFIEPLCNKVYISNESLISAYIERYQHTTSYNLSERVLSFNSITDNISATNEITVTFETNNLTNNSGNILNSLTDIITDSGEIGQFTIDCFTITINSMQTHDNKLIVCSTTKN